MAKRYGKLPSEVLNTATTFDLKCLDITMSWVSYKRIEQETGRPPAPKLTVAQMEAKLKALRDGK